jgi:hypothetical protein
VQVGEGNVTVVGAEGGEAIAGKVSTFVAKGDTALTSAGQKPAPWAPVVVEWATAALAADVVWLAVKDLAGGLLQPLGVPLFSQFCSSLSSPFFLYV